MIQKAKGVLIKGDFVRQRRWIIPMRPFFLGVNQDFYKKYDFLKRPVSMLYHIRASTAVIIVSKKEFSREGNKIIGDLLSGKRTRYDFFLRNIAAVKAYIKKYDLLAEDVDYATCKELNMRHSRIMRSFFSFDFAMTDWLEELRNANPSLAERFTHAICPIEESFVTTESRELRKIFEKTSVREFSELDNDRKLKKKLLRHAGKWRYIQNNYRGIHRETTRDLLYRGIDLLRNEKKTQPRTNQKKNLLLLPKQYHLLAQAVSAVFTLKDERKRWMLIGVELFQKYLDAVARKHNISSNDLAWLTFDEVRMLERGKSAYRNPWVKRQERWLAFFDNRVCDISKGVFEHIKKQERIEDVRNEVRGIIAQKGSYVGKVKICLSREDFRNFKRGNVLITSMTRPDFLPVMEKAGAFVTDEGGITCHAAIIAREMNKPCIIGTKIATQVLKDGMLVEVDADNGMVRILER